MERQGRGLVLNTRVRAEADLVVVLFTRDRGKLSATAKSAMKSKKRFIGQLLIFNHLDVTIATSRRSGILRLDQSRLIESFPVIRRDIRRVAVASCLSEMVDIAAPEAEPAPRIYELLLAAFQGLNNKKDPDRIRLIYELKLIALLGYRPALENCALCGKELGEMSLSFSANEGGVVCKRCARAVSGAESISPAAVKSLRKALLMPDHKIGRLGFTKNALRESLHFVTLFVRYYLHRPLKSELFLEKLQSGADPI